MYKFLCGCVFSFLLSFFLGGGNVYLFIWLHWWVLVGAHGISVLCYGVQNL